MAKQTAGRQAGSFYRLPKLVKVQMTSYVAIFIDLKNALSKYPAIDVHFFTLYYTELK